MNSVFRFKIFQIRFIYLIVLFSLLFGCKSGQKASSPIRQISPDINCPEGGDCTFEILKKSRLEIKKDEFGKLYPEVIAGNKLVLRYHFKKKVDKNIMDNSYSEFIYLEIDKNEEQIILTDGDLQKVKMLYGRICFCRGSMGYFKVTDGQLFLFNKNKKLSMNLTFDVSKVPQIITEITENLSY